MQASGNLSNSERRNFVCRLNLRGWRSYIHEGSGCLAGILAEHEMTHLTLLPRPADKKPTPTPTALRSETLSPTPNMKLRPIFKTSPFSKALPSSRQQ